MTANKQMGTALRARLPLLRLWPSLPIGGLPAVPVPPALLLVAGHPATRRSGWLHADAYRLGLVVRPRPRIRLRARAVSPRRDPPIVM